MLWWTEENDKHQSQRSLCMSGFPALMEANWPPLSSFFQGNCGRSLKKGSESGDLGYFTVCGLYFNNACPAITSFTKIKLLSTQIMWEHLEIISTYDTTELCTSVVGNLPFPALFNRALDFPYHSVPRRNNAINCGRRPEAVTGLGAV